MQVPPPVGDAEGMIPWFVSALPTIDQQHERLVEKDLFGLRLRNPVLLVFPGVAMVPVERRDPVQVDP